MNPTRTYIILSLLLVILAALNIALGSVRIPLGAVADILSGGDGGNQAWRVIVLQSRVPQCITALFCGAALSAAGLMLQTTLANPLAFETVFERANNADFWLFKYNRATDYTYTALAAENDLYTQFTPFSNRKIYGCNTDYVPYYDEVPFRPDWFLRDLVRIFHPELLPDYEMRYFSPLE